VKIKMYGAGKEVGRSCIELRENETRILLDCGLKLIPQGIEHPLTPAEVEKIDAIILSHAHLDHCGSIPLFDHFGFHGSILMTRATQALTHILLQDSFEIELLEKKHPVYSKQDIERIMQSAQLCEYHVQYSLKDATVTLFDAGHIPGSSSVYVELGKKRVLYTGDINTQETLLMKEAQTNFPVVDILISESTYGDRLHPDRKKTEEDFLKKVADAIEHGPVLLPSFAVGRAQEIVLLLNRKNFDYPIYVDGMARRVTHAIFNFPTSIKNVQELQDAYQKVKEVHGFRERQTILNERAIFITTSGMLDGGPVVDYLKHFHTQKDASIFLTGYQAEGSSGRMLLEKRQVVLDKRKTDVQCKVDLFDFSAHAGQDGLKKIIQKVKPKILIIVHGEEKSMTALAAYAMGLGIKVYMPKNGDEIVIND